MRVIFCLLILVLGFGGNAFGQKPFEVLIHGQKTFSDDKTLLPLQDGGYIIRVVLSNTRHNSSGVCITRFDACHNILWSKIIPDEIFNFSQKRNIILTADNGYVLCNAVSDGLNYWPVIIKLNDNGEILWSKKLSMKISPDEIWNGYPGVCAPTSDSGIIVGCNVGYHSNSGQHVLNMVTKLNSSGDVVWSKKLISTNNIQTIEKILIMPDSDFAVVMSFREELSTYTAVIKMNSAGKIRWHKKIGKLLATSGPANGIHAFKNDAEVDKNGNIYLLALHKTNVTSLGEVSYYSQIIKIDSNGKYQRNYTINSNSLIKKFSEFTNFYVTKNQSIIFTATNSDKNAIYGEMDMNGKILWLKHFPDHNATWSNPEIHETADNGILCLNSISPITTELTKISQNGISACKGKDSSFWVLWYFNEITDQTIHEDTGYVSGNIDLKLADTHTSANIICGQEFYPISDLDNDTIICNAKSFTLRAGEDNLGYGHKFMWSTGSTDSVITVTKSGKYWLAISSGYCTNTDTVNIVFREEIQSKIPDQSICPYDSVLIKAPNISAAKYYWIKPDKSIFKQHDIWAKDTGTYYLMLEGNGNCLNIDTFRLQHHKLPQASAGPDTILCHNQSYEMQGKGGISYKWIPAKYLSNDAIPNPIATAPDTQIYMLIVKNAFGCADTSQMWLRVKPKLQVKITAQNQAVCSGEKVLLQAFASGGDSLHYTYNWQNIENKETAFETTFKQSGWIKVTLEDGCSERAKDSIFITVKPTPVAAFYTDPKDSAIAENKVQFINQSQHATNYQWSFGTGETSNSANPTYIYTDTGKYLITLIAQNTNGCSDTAYGQIYIAEKFRIFIPNAFTPDGDLNNDVFSVYGTGIKDYSYEIYNRWGERIFTSSATKPNWNGAVENRGEVVQMDVYFYVLKVKDIENRMHYFNGTINLLR